MKKHLLLISIFIGLIILGCCALVVIIIVASRGVINSNLPATPTPAPALVYGQKATTLTPPSFDVGGLNHFWEIAKDCCSLVGWYGNWEELAKNNGGVAGSTIKTAREKGVEPYIIVSPFNQSTGKFTETVSDANTENYLASSEQFVKQYQPHYFGIGVEINLLYDKSPSGYQQFLAMYKSAYARIKAAAPNTQVFPVFQLEQLKGLRGGLFGKQNDVSKNDWKLLADFKDVSDMTAFTSYPGLIYGKPADIPTDYYTQITQYTDKPIIISELGWFTTGVKGWESSESEQADFMNTYFSLTKNVPIVFSAWALLYDQQNQSVFTSMGLIDDNGNQKAAYSVWLNH